MGGRGSSSKAKSSKRKRDKASSKKKSRRNEPKKRRRTYDSVTSYSDDDSEHSLSANSKSRRRRRINKKKKLCSDTSVSSYFDCQSVSSDSDSLSTHDNSYKRRKARRSRVGLKDAKRRGRKRFTSPNGDVDARSVRKRKRLGRDHVVKPLKKSSKKKSRIHLSSSASSDSESCSTCQSKSSSSTGDGKRKRSKVTPDKEIDKLRGRESHRSKMKRKVRTPSCSSRGRGSDPSFGVSNSDGAFFPVNNSRRLRSVIAVVDQPHDEGGNRWEKDPHKEEIEYDQNDYPSPKSLDSNEGGTKMESGNHSLGEKFAGEEVPELGKSRVDEDDRKNGNDCWSEGGHMNNCEKEKEIETSVPVAASEGDARESILRQKALENLRKFRGMPHTGARSPGLKKNNENNVDGSSAVMVDIVHDKSMNQRTGLSLKRDSSIKEVKKIPDSKQVEKEPEMDEKSVVHPPNEAALVECSAEVSASSRDVLAKPVSGSDISAGAGGTIVCSSTTEPSSSVQPSTGEDNLERGNDPKDGSSQFEKKTMSVVRGGETVQVSYKVYIPKKTPALARRQLRR